MREELLSHLTGIYEEELARLGNPTVALRAAADRFGDPATLASELNETLPLAERATYFINRSQGQRPHESVPHYMLRLATGMTAFVAAFFCCLVLVALFLKDGWNVSLILAKPLIGILPFMFVDVFLLGLLYFKLRDAICGAPWARKSWPRNHSRSTNCPHYVWICPGVQCFCQHPVRCRSSHFLHFAGDLRRRGHSLSNRSPRQRTGPNY